MNREERRRQERQLAKAGLASRNLHVKTLFDEGVAHHQAGRLQQAEQVYRQILEEDPNHAEALHLVGVIAYRDGRYDQAIDLISQAIQKDGGKSNFFFNQGLVYHRMGKLEAAEISYQRSIQIKPDYVEAHGNLGNVFRDKGNLAAAVAAYQKALQCRPNYAGGYNNLGVAFKEQGKLTQAVEAYQHALRINPENAESHYNLGMVFMEWDQPEEAIAAFETAIHMNPHYAKAHHNLGLALMWKQQFEVALSSFRKSAELTQNHGRPLSPQYVYSSRVKHDAEQLQYLTQRGLVGSDVTGYGKALEELRERISPNGQSNQQIRLSQEETVRLAPSFNRILYYADSPALSQGALNPHLDVEEIQNRYNAKKPEIISVDSLLTEEALRSLRQFCLASTIWKKDYENGYVGAFLGEGFSSPLLFQIAEELRLRFPEIFHNHRLVQAWAFKQDNQLRPLNIHADAAAVNVNFWITENEANLEASSGGLIVWDKEAPKDWDFKIYNGTQFKPKIYEFLKQNAAEPVRVPFRENRAVIFNSDLFHESDRCVFRDQYECRRINVTMLYGRRSKNHVLSS